MVALHFSDIHFLTISRCSRKLVYVGCGCRTQGLEETTSRHHSSAHATTNNICSSIPLKAPILSNVLKRGCIDIIIMQFLILIQIQHF